MSDDNPPIEIDGTQFTKEQVDRQSRRIYEYVFIEADYDNEGAYGGQVKPEIMACFKEHIVFDQIIDEEVVAHMVGKVIEAVSALILENVNAVHPLVAKVFSADFVPAAFDQFYSIQSASAPSGNFDPAYG